MPVIDLGPAEDKTIDLGPVEEKKLGQNSIGAYGLGALGAAADVVGQTPGFIGALTAAGAHGLTGGDTGRSPMQTLQEVMGSASKGNPLDYVPGMESLRKFPGYEGTSKAISGMLTEPTQGYGNVAASVASHFGMEDKAVAKLGENVDAGLQAAVLLAGLKPHALPKPGTMEFFQQRAKLETSIDQIRQNAAVREQNIKNDPLHESNNPILPSLPKKQVRDLGEIGNFEQTPEVLNQDFRMSERAGEDPRSLDVQVDPLKAGLPFKPTLDETAPPTSVPFDKTPSEPTGAPTPGFQMQGVDYKPALKGPEAVAMPEKQRIAGEQAAAYVNKMIEQRKAQNVADEVQGKMLGGTGAKGFGQGGAVQFVQGGTRDNNTRQIPVHENPTRDSAQQLAHNSSEGEIRGLYDPTTKSTHWWDAARDTHEYMIRKLGIDPKSRHLFLKDGEVADTAYRFAGETRHPDMPWVTTDNITRSLHTSEKNPYFEAGTNRPAYLGQMGVGSGQRGGAKIGKMQTGAEKLASDKDLVDKYKAGDSKAFESIYNKYSGMILKSAKQMVRGDEMAAHDIVQETFIKATKGLHDFNFDNKAQLSTWLYGIMKNAVRDKVRKDMRRPKETIMTDAEGDHVGYDTVRHDEGMSSAIPPPDRVMEAREQEDRLAQAVDSLPDDLQLTLKLWKDEELSYAEIARLQGIPQGTVMSRLSSIKDKLAAKIKQIKKSETSPNARTMRLNVGPGGKQRGAINFEFATPPEPTKMVETVKKATESIRDKFDYVPLTTTLPEFMAERPEIWKPENIKDIDRGDVPTLNFNQARTNSILYEKLGAAGAVLRFANDRVIQITRTSDLATDRQIKATIGSDSAWGQLDKELRPELVQKIVENAGTTLGVEAFSNSKLFDAYKEIRSALDDSLDRINQAAKDVGKKGFRKLEGYFPSRWEGDYRVITKDAEGKTIYGQGFSTRFFANKALKLLEGKLPEGHTAEVFEIGNHPNKDTLSNMYAFEETMRALDEDSAAARAVQKVYKDILGSRGEGVHGREKTGVGGFLGSEGGLEGAKNFQKTLEQHLKASNNYIANMQMEKSAREILDLPPEVKKAMPKMMDHIIGDYISNAKGFDLGGDRQVMRGLVEGISSIAGFGKSGGYKVGRAVRTVASIFLLDRFQFFIGNWFQPGTGLPRMAEVRGKGGDIAPMHALFNGYLERINGDPVGKELIEWAGKNGVLDSSITAMMGMTPGDVHGSGLGMVGDAHTLIQNWHEHQAVRVPVLLGYESMLRESVPDKVQRFQRAANMMDYDMGNYNRTEAPLMYPKMGILGDGMKSLSSYPHNVWGHFFEFAQMAKDKGSIRPLATMLGTQIALAGTRGMILTAEVGAIATLINTVMQENLIPLPEEYIQKAVNKGRQVVNQLPDSFKKSAYQKGLDAFSNGIPSAVTGYDISPTINSPGFGQFASIPITKWTYDGLHKGITYLIHKFTHVATDADAMAALKAISPLAFSGQIDEAYSKPGEPVPRPADQMAGNYTRTDVEKMVAKYLSMKSIDETRADAIVRIVKQNLMLDMQERKNALNSMVSDVRNGKGPSDDNIQKYIQTGGDPGQLLNSIHQHMVDQQLEYQDRKLQGGITNSKGNTARELGILEQSKKSK